MNTKKPLVITTADLVLPDVIVRVQGSTELVQYVKEHNLKGIDKRALTKEEFLEVSPIIDRMEKAGEVKVQPGGSSANMLVTLSKLLGSKKVHVNYFGVVGKDDYVKVAQDSLVNSGISLLPNSDTYKEQNPESARSFVLVHDDGSRTILTYPGTARSILKPEMITDDIIKNSDIVFALGSVWQRFEQDFADRLVTQRWNHRDNGNVDNKDNGNGNNKKELWLALPTNAKFGEDHAGRFQFILPSANLILSNIKELSNIYKTDPLYKPDQPETALKALQHTFKSNPTLEKEGYKGQVAFITLGVKGAAVVTKEEILHIPSRKIEKEEIVNELGAGDTAFAGFAAGYMKGLPHTISAEIAMSLANQKLRHNKARLEDPQAALREASPKLADQLLGRERDAHLAGVGNGFERG